ncbi:hypothetical protein [Sciscionella sediminilitoris]|uniref:hypothetical protein n=1 Tax=Sciscionella sediminilitoris TaxID=1445613 RepID=UPI00068DABE8|nr:hypothetical protein [Sciscionella sp. SE31]
MTRARGTPDSTGDGEYAIFVNGSYGTGKSAALEHIGDLLATAGQAFSLMDIDWFHRSWPPAGFDPDNTLIEARNMALVWSNYRATGPRQLVVSGVLGSRAELDRYSRSLNLTVRPVRLVASPQVTETRLRGRYTAAQRARFDWHASRHRELGERLAEADMDEAVIDTDTLAPAEVAAAVLRHFGYLAAS